MTYSGSDFSGGKTLSKLMGKQGFWENGYLAAGIYTCKTWTILYLLPLFIK